MSELEQQIVNHIRSSLGEIIVKNLSGYSSPLEALIKDVFEQERDEVTSIVKSVLSEVISAPEFREEIKVEFRRKVAKALVGTMTGQVEKAVVILKQDPTFKSRMILALNNLIDSELANQTT